MTAPVIFIKKDLITYSLPIPTGKTAQERAVNDNLVKANKGNRNIRFTHIVTTGVGNPKCSFVTEHPQLIKYLNDWNKIHKKLHVDVSMMPMKCHICDFSTPDGSEASKIALAQHQLDHASDEIQEEEIALDERSYKELQELAAEAGFTDDQVKENNSKVKLIALIKGEEAE